MFSGKQDSQKFSYSRLLQQNIKVAGTATLMFCWYLATLQQNIKVAGTAAPPIMKSKLGHALIDNYCFCD